MQTREIQAQRLTTRSTLVLGGDGKPQTAHQLCEVQINAQLIEVRLAGSFERVTFQPRDKVRVQA